MLVPHCALRELRLINCEVTADAAAALSDSAARLRVLHLVRCCGDLRPLLQAAYAAEDVSLDSASGGAGLLAGLHPAARTLRTLDASNLEDAVSAEEAHSIVAGGLTSLMLTKRVLRVEAVGTIARLTQLRRLRLGYPAVEAELRLRRLSTLGRLTALELSGGARGDTTGGWLEALAAARVPLRELRLCDGGVKPGYGAEAAIGRLTRLTSLHMSVDRHLGDPRATLQLQLLGRGAAGVSTSSRAGASCCSGGDGGAAAADRNAGLQELSLECTGWLMDGELAAAAAALPDLRRLEVLGSVWHGSEPPRLFSGAGLAAFCACQRLRSLLLRRCPDLSTHRLGMHVLQLSGLASMRLESCLDLHSATRMYGTAVQELRDAFMRAHGRRLRVDVACVNMLVRDDEAR